MAAMGTLGIGFLCMAVLAAFTLAQPKPADPKPKTDPVVKPKAKPDAAPKQSPKDAPGAKPAPKARPGRGRGSRGGAGFAMNPDAKWACDKQTMTLEPVWRGDKPVTFSFDIRNEGTANLKIKARGG